MKCELMIDVLLLNRRNPVGMTIISDRLPVVNQTGNRCANCESYRVKIESLGITVTDTPQEQHGPHQFQFSPEFPE